MCDNCEKMTSPQCVTQLLDVCECAYLYLCGGDVADIFCCQLFQQSGLASIIQAEQQ